MHAKFNIPPNDPLLMYLYGKAYPRKLSASDLLKKKCM